MDVRIEEGDYTHTVVVIQCQKETEPIICLKRYIEKYEPRIQAYEGKKLHYVSLDDIWYFESVDNKTFLYLDTAVLEISQRLYELESLLPPSSFIRISKSQIVNIGKIKSLRPELNRTLLATLYNEEQLVISRRYVAAFKKRLHIER